jgi:KUP system potassium uptake protein
VSENGPRALTALAVTAVGVVYGDIGTSPLYALRECFFGPHRVPVSQDNVLGVLSLVFWTLIVVVTLKYHLYVIHADNRGEGGVLALTALVRGRIGQGRRRWLIVSLGIFGAALLYGDGIITPAISVLGAIEGLDIATPELGPWVVPITVAILIGLFLFQRRGTAGVGAVFGPVMLLWFGTIAVLGVAGIVREPDVLRAVNPAHAARFFAANGFAGLLVLGAVFLVATGGEALYADLGHFGERPIQIAWFTLVGPALLLNYFGQGALLLSNPDAADNPFYRLAPSWALYPLVALATAAAIIASQAIISGAFSLTRQAIQLGYLPRLEIIHTSATEIGQIYIPLVNGALMVATIALVLGFRSSSNLASAYGVAVTSTMVITTVLAYFVTRLIWGWGIWLAAAVTAAFLAVDLAFFGANIIKVGAGGWLPLVIAGAIFALMTTWERGGRLLMAKIGRNEVPVEQLQEEIEQRSLCRVQGAAVFLTGDPKNTPRALLHNLKHNKVLHQQNVFLTIVNEEIPYVSQEDRLSVEDLGQGFYRVIARFGFLESPDIPAVLNRAKERGCDLDPRTATYLVSHSELVPSRHPRLWRWRERLFIYLARNAMRPTRFFRIPHHRVVEIGTEVEI